MTTTTRSGTGLPGRMTVRRPLGSIRRDRGGVLRHLDLVLLGTVGAICLLGLLMIYSVTRGSTPPYDLAYVKKQAMFMILGVPVLALCTWVDYRRLRDFALPLYVITLALLLAVLVPGLGSNIKGTQGWFVLGPFQLQPSEIAKLAIIVALAALGAQFRGDVDLRRMVALMVVAGIPALFIMIEPDLGQGLVIGCILLGVLAVAGVQAKHLVVLLALLVVGGAVVLQTNLLDRYQRDRLVSFTQQESGSKQLNSGIAYNLAQAKIATGSGGVFGKGLFQGPQTKNGVVPEQRTDFIFTAVGEQFGFLGSAGLLTLYGIMMWRIWRAAQLARDDAGTLICVGIFSMFLFQIFENAGMTMGIMPITGITLPFMSYGGSSLLIGFASIGLVLNVHMRRFS